MDYMIAFGCGFTTAFVLCVACFVVYLKRKGALSAAADAAKAAVTK